MNKAKTNVRKKNKLTKISDLYIFNFKHIQRISLFCTQVFKLHKIINKMYTQNTVNTFTLGVHTYTEHLPFNACKYKTLKIEFLKCLKSRTII